MQEVWKDIEGYEGKYQISNLGRIKSLNYNRTGEEKLLKPLENKCGYVRVVLYKDRRAKNYLIHRLVAETFIPNPNNYPIINHKDENKQNNKVKNLEWCTYEYNNTYGSTIERAVEKRKEYIILAVKKGYVVYNTTRSFEKSHTHLRSFSMAKTIIDNCITKKTPKTNNLYLLESHVRVSNDAKYIRMIEELIEAKRNKDKLKYRNKNINSKKK